MADPLGLVGLSGILGMNIFLLLGLMIWALVWKGIALWKCGRNNQLVWFVVILIINSVGILPIVYIVFFQKKKKK